MSQYMRKDVPTISEGATVKHVVLKMIEGKTNGLVVLDKSSRACGIISSWDIIKYLVPDYLEEDESLAAFETSDLFVKRVNEIAGDSVEKFMSTKVHTIRQDKTLMEAATLLTEFQIRQLPVVDETGNLVGYINRTDIKNAIGEMFKSNN